MPECKLSQEFLSKRRHQRQTAKRAVYDVGQRFRLIYGPRKLEPELLKTERQIVRIATSLPATFGSTQLHQTTSWSIEKLEQYYHGGRLLDVGTGAGLLAICAAMLGKSSSAEDPSQHNSVIEAFDIYNDAIKQAQTNLRLNGLSKAIELQCANLANYPLDSYALVIGNLPPIAISELWRGLVIRLATDGILILSGLLRHNLPKMIEQLSSKGLYIIDKVETDLWCVVVARRPRNQY